MNLGESRIEEALKETFGLDKFKPGQEELIKATLDGLDVFGVMPTSGGKSLCYQLPAVLREGTTLIIQPLIGLMDEQRDKLRSLGIATFSLHSGLSQQEEDNAIGLIRQGLAKIVFTSPDRVTKTWFQEAMGPIDFVNATFDEAHCVSTWGHDFRPNYLEAGPVLQSPAYGIKQFGAYTATSSPKVEADIRRYIPLRKEETTSIEVSPIRPNLDYGVIDVEVPEEGGIRARKAVVFKAKIEAIKKQIAINPGTSIVYCERVSDANKVGYELEELFEDRVRVYHAKIEDKDEKRESLQHFLSSQSPIMSATIALGMGMDRGDIRNVIHFDVPDNLLAYAQETGRAGRDDQVATCAFLRAPEELRRSNHFKEFLEMPPSIKFVEGVYKSFRKYVEKKEEKGGKIPPLRALLRTFKGAYTRQVSLKPDDEMSEDEKNNLITSVLRALNILETCGVIKTSFKTGKSIDFSDLSQESKAYHVIIKECKMRERSSKAARTTAKKFSEHENPSQALLWYLIDPKKHPKPSAA